MSDLISRRRLLQMLEYNRNKRVDENGETRQLIAININRMIEYVEKMPVAYDPEEVAEELVRNGTKMSESKLPGHHYKAICVTKAADIVRAGRKEYRHEGE